MANYDAMPIETVVRHAPECENCADRRMEGERGENRWCLDHRYTIGGWPRPKRTY